jgi:hypothetical protein
MTSGAGGNGLTGEGGVISGVLITFVSFSELAAAVGGGSSFFSSMTGFLSGTGSCFVGVGVDVDVGGGLIILPIRASNTEPFGRGIAGAGADDDAAADSVVSDDTVGFNASVLSDWFTGVGFDCSRGTSLSIDVGRDVEPDGGIIVDV